MTHLGTAGARSEEALELLERALSYTRGALAEVTPAHLQLPTPCREWLLIDLLTHMDDALDAFTDGARGRVPLSPSTPLPPRVERLHDKACRLLGAWSRPVPARSAGTVSVAGLPVARDLVASLAALEIAVHGWDVATTTGHRRPLPESLAAGLLPTAVQHIAASDRDRRFAAALPSVATQPSSVRLLAHLGRDARSQDV